MPIADVVIVLYQGKKSIFSYINNANQELKIASDSSFKSL